MKQFVNLHKTQIYLIILIVIGGFLRFYNLNWGSPFYFHPDERNIASSISQLRFPNQMNPHFFAYGSFPIYIIYFLGLIGNVFLNCKLPVILACPESPFSPTIISFEQAVVLSRLISSTLSILLIPLLYIVGKNLKDKKTAMLAAILGTFSVGLIQFSHFGTFEIWLTFFSLLFFYLNLKLVKEGGLKNIILAGLVLGILNTVKISSLAILPIPILSIILNFIKHKSYYQYTNILVITHLISRFLILLSIAFLAFLITSPFVFLDFSSFRSSIQYESDVALGTLPVFYTQEFYDTIPVIFQFAKIYPFVLNPFLTILFIPSFIYLIYTTIKQKDFSFCLLFSVFCLLFLPNSFIFAKWTRYIIPTLPFIYLIISMFLVDLVPCRTELISAAGKIQKHRYYCQYIGILAITVVSVILTFSYFITVFAKPDTRVSASLWAKKNIPSNSNIISDVYDMGIVPFNPYFSDIKLFNFYDLDLDSVSLKNLNQILVNVNYIILPSQRIMKTRFINAKKFPAGHNFYKSLFEERTEFKKIYKTPCDLFCKITYLNNPVFSFEETANVFDRPTVFIFKKK